MTNFSHLVSIIIPTYNRADVLSETLDSIISQTYYNWECIVVDDGSTENNVKIVKDYAAKDSRFKLFERKNFDKPKGANACRNIGLENSIGDYLIFFDSDDLMIPEHIEKKIRFITENDYDFIVAKSKYFNHPENMYIDYSFFKKYTFNIENYMTNKLRFFTNDLIINNKIAKKCVFFYKYQATTENILMTQLVYLSKNFSFLDETVTLKRYDDQGGNITSTIHNNSQKFLRYQFFYYFNIIDYLIRYNKNKSIEDFNLNNLIFFYRKIDFPLEVPFFTFISKLLIMRRFDKIYPILIKRIKKW